MQKRKTKSPAPPASKAAEIEISIRDQSLVLRRGGRKVRSYQISSSRFGLGTEEGSRKTPWSIRLQKPWPDVVDRQRQQRVPRYE